MTPSILNTSQVLMTSPLNLSLVFSKQNNINNGISPVSPWKSSNNLGKEHARNKTQTSSNNAEESKTERDGSFQQRKRKTMLKNNSSSNIFEKSCMRKKMGSKDQSVNVKKINLISRQEDNHDSSLHEFEKILKLKKQSSNRSENFTEYKEDFETSIAYQKTHHYLKKREKIRIFEEKKFRKERKRLRQDLKQQQNQKKHLLLLNKKIEDNKETIARGIKNLMKENLSIKIALDFLQISDSKLSINFDFLLKTPGIIIPTTDFRVFYDRVLGNGGFGTVYEGQFANKRVAIKVMDVPLDYLKMLLKEIITMVMCDHTNLVKLFAVSFGNAENNNVKVFILMECLKQDLKNLIFRERAHLPPKLKYKILISILKGLNFLHESHYVHCDLKLQNILVDEHFNAKISDFGLANCLRFGNTKNTMIAGYSERTSAYEYLCEQKISTKGDIWSFGIMMYELLMEKISWEKFSGVQVVAKVSLKTPFFDCNQRTGSKFEEEIIEECLNYNHNKRPSAKELINKLEMFVGRLKS